MWRDFSDLKIQPKKEGSLGKNSRALGQKRRSRREKIDTGIL